MIQANETLIQDLIQKRRELHQYPEVAFEEKETTRRLTNWLEEAGIPVLPLNLETGVVAEITGAHPGPVIALRSDIDALPVTEETNLSFESKVPGKMHACGHDFHMAAILGAALLLNEQKENLHGSVRILFQPAEEVAEGAEWITERGALEGVSAIFGMHNKPDLPVGTIGIKSGSLMASVDRFEITFKGVGGHAGIPHETVDPIIIASQYVLAAQTILARKIDLFHNAVLSITHIEGGSTWNVIPDTVMLEGTVRTFQPEARQQIEYWMKKMAESTAEGQGGKVDFSWMPKMPTVQNDTAYKEVLWQTAAELGYKPIEAEPSSGGEDFAFYQEHVPGFFVWMGSNGAKQWHHPEFTVDEAAIKVASEYFANLAVNVLDNAKNRK